MVKRILDLEFVEISELTADVWQDDVAADTANPVRRSTIPHRAPDTDIHVWLEGFGCMASILVTRFLEKGPELWAYQATIVKAARNYEGSAWVAYDRQFRQQALARKDLNWSVIDFRLYNEALPEGQSILLAAATA